MATLDARLPLDQQHVAAADAGQQPLGVGRRGGAARVVRAAQVAAESIAQPGGERGEQAKT